MPIGRHTLMDLKGAITMTDRLISKRDMAAMLGTSPGVAAFILEE